MVIMENLVCIWVGVVFIFAVDEGHINLKFSLVALFLVVASRGATVWAAVPLGGNTTALLQPCAARAVRQPVSWAPVQWVTTYSRGYPPRFSMLTCSTGVHGGARGGIVVPGRAVTLPQLSAIFFGSWAKWKLIR